MKRIVFAALVFALSIGAYGKTISGYVSDAKSSEKLGYATVMLKRHDVGMICDSCGFFKLEIPDKAAGDSVEFRYIGYEPTLISLNDMTKETNVPLKQKSKKLKEITVKTPHKFKTMKSGKKHTSGLFLSFLGGIDDPHTKGDTYGFWGQAHLAKKRGILHKADRQHALANEIPHQHLRHGERDESPIVRPALRAE